MSRTYRGFYEIKNLSKYIGSNKPYARSTWELAFMRFCDENTNVLHWGSETIKIPYLNPITHKYTVYVPDFFVVYVDKNGKQHAELIEVKPKKEAALSEAKSVRDKIRLTINAAKWAAALEFCKKKGIFFRIVTEDDLFRKYK